MSVSPNPRLTAIVYEERRRDLLAWADRDRLGHLAEGGAPDRLEGWSDRLAAAVVAVALALLIAAGVAAATAPQSQIGERRAPAASQMSAGDRPETNALRRNGEPTE